MSRALLDWNVPARPEVDMTPAADSPSVSGVASLRGSASSIGKLAGSGGGSGKLVYLILVNRECSCLGFIGSNRSKICLAPKGCEIKSHDRERFIFPDGVVELVFIDTGGNGPSAWAMPWAELSWFGSTWERYRVETRNVTQWQTFLEGMASSAVYSDKDVERMGEATLTTKEMFTPFKKRKADEDALSVDGSVASYQDVMSANYSPLKPSADYASQASTVGQNFDWLWRMALAAKKGNEEIEETLADVVMRLEARIGELKAIIGSRSSELGTATVFGVLDSHDVTFKEIISLWKALTSQVNLLASTAVPDMEEWKLRVKDEVYADLSIALAPLRALFSRQSSHINQPGDRLEAEFLGIRQELNNLDRRIQQLSAAPALVPNITVPSPLSWGVGTVPTSSNQFSVGAQIAATVAPPSIDIQSLERKVARLEEQLDTRAVKVGMKTFSSRPDAAAWLTINCPNPGSYAFFLDFHSLLALAQGQGNTQVDILKFQETSAKLKYASTDEAIVVASFQMEIPAFFGKASAGATGQSARVLPGMTTFGAWDATDGERGLRYDIKHQVKLYIESWRDSAEYNLSPDAMGVAQAMMHTSVMFIEKVSGWVTTFYNDCEHRGANDLETWRHISHTVREICNILHDARRAGRGIYTTSSERASCSFWGLIQAHREMETMTSRSLEADPRLSHILNLHLRDNAVMKSELKPINDAIRVLQRDAARGNKKVVIAPGAGRGAGATRTEES